MRPEYTPELELNGISVSDEPVQLGNVEDTKFMYGEFPKEGETIELKFKMKPCYCALCRHNYQKIGIKKSIKWHSAQASYYRKKAKQLKDKGIRNPILSDDNSLENQLFLMLEYYIYHKEYCYYLRQIRKGLKECM